MADRIPTVDISETDTETLPTSAFMAKTGNGKGQQRAGMNTRVQRGRITRGGPKNCQTGWWSEGD